MKDKILTHSIPFIGAALGYALYHSITPDAWHLLSDENFSVFWTFTMISTFVLLWGIQGSLIEHHKQRAEAYKQIALEYKAKLQGVCLRLYPTTPQAIEEIKKVQEEA